MKTLKKFEFPTPAARSTYDWDKFLDGGIYQLEAGKDYDCKDQTFRMMAYKQAAKAHKNVQVAAVEGGLVIKATPMTPAEVKAYDKKVADKKAEKEAAKAAGGEAADEGEGEGDEGEGEAEG